MKCPRCESTSYRKNGHRSGKQNYLCKNCGKQFIEPTTSSSLDQFGDSPNAQAKNVTEATIISHGVPIDVADNSAALVNPKDVAVDVADDSAALVNPKDVPVDVADDSAALVNVTAEELLQTLLSPDWLESSSFQQFIHKVKFEIQPQLDAEAGISLLLLDAENIKLDFHAETFLASICQYPLKVKIAFANWRNPSIGKQDADLYERGYQLVHVPGGKDSADGKMIALGAAILRPYPTVKEVLVCSGDGILTHLCNELQHQGLTVYWVRRQAQTLLVENRTSGKVSNYSLTMVAEVPFYEGVIDKIEDLINAERDSITERLSKLVTVANLFQERQNLTKQHSSEEEILLNPKESPPTTQNAEQSPQSTITPTSIKSITSRYDLEKALIQIIREMQLISPQSKLSVAKLGTELRKRTGESASLIIKRLKLGSSFTKFLESCQTFKLKKNGKEYHVAIRE